MTITLLSIVVVSSLLSVPGETQSAGNFAALQATTPGTTQSGNITISGTAKVGGFVMPTGASTGRVLGSSNLQGVAAWQEDGLKLPFSGSGGSLQSLLSIVNSNTGSAILGSAFNGTGISGTTGLGRGVSGSATNASGYGGYFENTSGATSAIALFGSAPLGTGISGAGAIGMLGTTVTDNGVGVMGQVTGGDFGSGGFFTTNAIHGAGVRGTSTNTSVSNMAPGVYGQSYAPSGIGVQGDGSIGVFAQTLNGNVGLTNMAIKAVDRTDNGGNYAIYAESQDGGTAVFGESVGPIGGPFYGGDFSCSSWSGAAVRGVLVAAGTPSITTKAGWFKNMLKLGDGVLGESTHPIGSGAGGRFTSTGDGGFGVIGNALSASGTTYGGHFTTASPSGGAVFASAQNTTGDSYGVQGMSAAPSGVGVYAIATATTGTARGLYAKSSAPEGRGLISVADAASGNSVGGYFLCGSTNGTGVYSQASAGTGQTAGGYFQSDSTAGTGLIGWASAATGSTKGVYGEAASTTGIGVMGESFATSGVSYGVFGEADSSSGRGVFGFASHLGAGATPYGVRGEASTLGNGYGVYANGDMGASGVKPFRIDHPLDPANRYLLHYSSESPFPQNFYNGNVTTDAKGYAWVQLPEYFEDVNTNFKYVLTIVDDGDSADFAQAKVSKKILGNQFQIRTNSPRVTVSWMVFADRNDRRIRYNRPTDERDKTGDEKGKYQHPEYYDLPPSLGMDYRVEQVRKQGK